LGFKGKEKIDRGKGRKNPASHNRKEGRKAPAAALDHEEKGRRNMHWTEGKGWYKKGRLAGRGRREKLPSGHNNISARTRKGGGNPISPGKKN